MKSRTKSNLIIPSGSVFDRARNEACRLDFVSFIELVFRLLNPGTPFRMNWHIRALAYAFEQVLRGRIKRLIINLPPRFLKSTISSIAFPVFALGHDPTQRILVVSHGLELASKFTYDSRIVMSSDVYKRIFPRTRLLRGNESEIVTTRTGNRFATSIDGPMTGLGGNIIIIDDPHKLSDAESDKRLSHVNEVYRNTIQSRLNDPENGAIIIVMQRLDPNDLCGTILDHPDGWTVLKFPLIAEQDEQIQIGENLYHLRCAGDLLHCEWFSQQTLDERRSLMDEKIFAAQYQQCPSQPTGYMIQRESIERYDYLPTRTNSDYVIQSWDTAVKTDEHHDYSACVTLRLDDRKNYYVTDVLRGRFPYHELLEAAISQAREHSPNIILVEDATLLGRTLVKDLKATGLSAADVVPEGDKLTRLSLQSKKFANGQVFFPKEAHWLAPLENECFAFPNGRYDDQVDALIQGLAWERPTPLWTDQRLENLNYFTARLLGF
jgi:predicted phage terminase large subunit-like protein